MADEAGIYTGLQASLTTIIAKNTITAGLYGYAQHESDLFGLVGSSPVNPVTNAGVQEAFVETNYKPTNMAHTFRRRARDALRRSHSRNCRISAVGNRCPDSQTQLGLSCLLRPFLSAAAAPHALRLTAYLRAGEWQQLSPAAWRT